MPIEYRIVLHARTVAGYDKLGEFFIGSDRLAANELFKSLKGSPDNLENGVLLMELREMNFSLLLDIKMIQCTLDEVADNCRSIAKNQFRLLNLHVENTGSIEGDMF